MPPPQQDFAPGALPAEGGNCPDSAVLTEAEVRAAFEAAGLSISAWARHHGFRRELVDQVLTGKLTGKRGLSHQIKVELGMKASPANTTSAQTAPADEIRSDLSRRGVSIAALARQLDVHEQIVRDLLSGKAKGHRGEAHRAAVLLGLKQGVIQPQGGAA